MRNSWATRLIVVTTLAALGAGCSGGPVAPTATPPSGVSTPSASPGTLSSPTQEDAILTLSWPDGSKSLTRAELWNHPKAHELTLTDQAAHSGRSITFHVVPMPELFAGITFYPGQTLEFDATDGFSASLNPDQVFNRDPAKATAYLAIEDPERPWPKLRDGQSTAGPLYLVWKDPEKSSIGQEQWPFQLRSFSLKASLESRFPALVPAAEIAEDDPVYRGYQTFLKNCFSCHTFNGQGTSRMGPDLNEPHSPTEYMHEEYLRKLIRNPQSLRTWKGSRMSSFSLEMLPEQELDDLIAYLRHQAKRRGPSERP